MAYLEIISYTLADPKDIIICVWCETNFTNRLKKLDCFHFGCDKCLNRQLQDRTKSDITCPKCSTVCSVPTEGVKGFLDEPIQKKIRFAANVFANTTPDCYTCSGEGKVSPSAHGCTSCQVVLCSSHGERHQTLRHKLLTLEQLQLPSNLPLISDSSVSFCEIHKMDTIDFCLHCDMLICSYCKKGHKCHETMSITDAAEQWKAFIENKIEEVQVAKLQAFEIIASHEKTQEFASAQPKNVEVLLVEQKNKIKQFDHIAQYLKLYLHFSSCSDILKDCKAFKKNLQNIAKRSVGVDFVSEDNSLDINKAESQHRPEKDEFGLHKKWLAGWWTGVALDANNIYVVHGKQICIFNLDGEKRGDIECEALENARDIEVYRGKLYVTDCGEKQREILIMDMEGTLFGRVSLPAGEDNIPGGVLGLAIDMKNGELFVCSNETNRIYQCQTNDCFAVPFVTEGLIGPNYMCVTPGHGVLVSCNDNTIKLFNRIGNLVWECHDDRSPKGVCIDPLGYIFIALCDNHKIYFKSMDSQVGANIDIGEEIWNPWAIKFKNNNLVITTGPGTIFVVNCRLPADRSSLDESCSWDENHSPWDDAADLIYEKIRPWSVPDDSDYTCIEYHQIEPADDRSTPIYENVIPQEAIYIPIPPSTQSSDILTRENSPEPKSNKKECSVM